MYEASKVRQEAPFSLFPTGRPYDPVMPRRGAGILDELSSSLNALSGVFSTPQWGGRAYKLPGPGGSRNSPKLLAVVSPCKTAGAVEVSFKLEPQRAKAIIRQYDWVVPHSFRTLAPSGWVTARVNTKRQMTALTRLLEESHALHPTTAKSTDGPACRRTSSTVAARRIDRVMSELQARGWSPPEDAPG